MTNTNQRILSQEWGAGKSPFFPDGEIPSIPIPELVFIPPGIFWMGSSDRDTIAGEDEKPLHRVYLDGYWIGRYQVTIDEYAAFKNDLESHHHFQQNKTHRTALPEVFRVNMHLHNRERHPVTEVSWPDAIAYCRWLSHITHCHFCLPSEAQWEKAARGGDINDPEKRIYPWGNDPPDRSRCNLANWFEGTTPVGLFSPQGDSPYGCADMAGNVLEWCGDWYRADGYAHAPCHNPTGPIRGTDQVLRGGCWCYPPVFARSASRLWLNPLCKYEMIGFRVAMC